MMSQKIMKSKKIVKIKTDTIYKLLKYKINYFYL